MKDAAAIAAQLVNMRNVGTHKSLQLTLHIPEEYALKAIEAFGWPTMTNPVPVAVARLVQPTGKEVGAETTRALNTAMPALGDVPARASKNKLAQLAGMLSKTPLFHRYIEAITLSHDITEDSAAEFIRARCQVRSRSQVLPDTPAEDRFLKLYDGFVRWRDADKFVETA